MPDLNTNQLETIRKLLVEPLREAVRQELRLSHHRLSSTIARMADRCERRGLDHDRRLATLERATATLRTFRRRALALYSGVTLVLSLLWSLLREKLTR